jgi:hypothetical protein
VSSVANFVVVSNRRCTYCARDALHVVHVPLSRKADDDAAWIGLCAYCVLAMAKALAGAKGMQA